MPFLQVLDVPDHLYLLLAEQAGKQRRSLAEETIAVLARGLQVELDPKARRQKVLRAINESSQARPAGLKNPAKSLREDRRR